MKGPIPTEGLGAIFPPQTAQSKLFGDLAEVASLTPTLVWEAFPQAEDRAVTKALAGMTVEDVTYELRIWKNAHGLPGSMVYERGGLSQPALPTPV